MDITQFEELQRLYQEVKRFENRLYEVLKMNNDGTYHNQYIIPLDGFPEDGFMFRSYESDALKALLERLTVMAKERLQAAEKLFNDALLQYFLKEDLHK